MISIVIPLYNVENYIIRCLLSFENQSYKNFEIIIVNDGSTDNSRILVEEFIMGSNMNISLINQVNSGVSVARNNGLLKAKGDYICFVDSDDMVVDKYLEQLESNIKMTNSDLVICGIKTITAEHSENIVDFDENSIIEMNTNEALTNFLYKKFVSGMGSFIIRKKVLIDNNLFFSESYRYSEDQEMLWKIINHSNKITLNNNKLYLYRVRPNSAMTIVDNKRLDGLNLMINLEEYFKLYNPEFYIKYKKHGVARWIWATLWQYASSSEEYEVFKDAIKEYSPQRYLKSLLTYPNLKVKISSGLFITFPKLYYIGVKRIINSKEVKNTNNYI